MELEGHLLPHGKKNTHRLYLEGENTNCQWNRNMDSQMLLFGAGQGLFHTLYINTNRQFSSPTHILSSINPSILTASLFRIRGVGVYPSCLWCRVGLRGQLPGRGNGTRDLLAVVTTALPYCPHSNMTGTKMKRWHDTWWKTSESVRCKPLLITLKAFLLFTLS